MPLLLSLLALVALARLLNSSRWRALDPLRARWRRFEPRAAGFIRSAPGTYVYLFVLAITTWVLQTSSPGVARRLLLERSTNLDHLAHDPVRVLVASAFWITHLWQLVFWAAAFSLVLAPVERWLGTARGVLVFATGHVGATLLTAVGLWAAIRADVGDATLANARDVGVSYGFLAVAGVLTFRLPRRWRWPYAAAAVGSAVGVILYQTTFTNFGHLAALLIGFACYLLAAPSSRSRAAPARRRS
jgi:hypothetical protein